MSSKEFNEKKIDLEENSIVYHSTNVSSIVLFLATIHTI